MEKTLNLREARQMWWQERKNLQITNGLPQDIKTADDAIQRLNREIHDADAADGLAG